MRGHKQNQHARTFYSSTFVRMFHPFPMSVSNTISTTHHPASYSASASAMLLLVQLLPPLVPTEKQCRWYHALANHAHISAATNFTHLQLIERRSCDEHWHLFIIPGGFLALSHLFEQNEPVVEEAPRGEHVRGVAGRHRGTSVSSEPAHNTTS